MSCAVCAWYRYIEWYPYLGLWLPCAELPFSSGGAVCEPCSKDFYFLIFIFLRNDCVSCESWISMFFRVGLDEVRVSG